MDDPFFMGRFEPFCNLLSEGKSLTVWNWTSLDTFGQRFSADEFHCEELPSARFVDAVNGGDVGMIQGRQNAGFALEPRHAVAIVTEGFGQKLDRNAAAQLRIHGPIHFAHATGSQMADYFELSELGSNHGVQSKRWSLPDDEKTGDVDCSICRVAKYKALQAVETFFWRAGDMLSAITTFVIVPMLGLGVRSYAGINPVL
jgi:hypothetical protein